MDRLLSRALDGVARDRHAGAAELALRAVTALEASLRRHPEPTEQDLMVLARTLGHAQPSMAPLLRLANECALALDSRKPAEALRKSLAKFESVLRTAPVRIARHFNNVLRGGSKWVNVATYSYSSTVLQALKHARQRIEFVSCSESRPGGEGRATAEQLAAAGVRVIVMTDIALASRMNQVGLFVTGADAVLPWGFVNKVGTDVLVLCALKARTPVWVLSDSTKFVPKPMASALWAIRAGRRSHVWRNPPAGVRPLNPLFEPTMFSSPIRLITERGWMTPAGVRRELRRIRVSPRLRALLG